MNLALAISGLVELGLRLVSAIGADGRDAERELLDHKLNEVGGALPIVLRINLQRPDPGRVVDGGVLVPTDSTSTGGLESQELDIHLDMVEQEVVTPW